jgi:hypothetical protein
MMMESSLTPGAWFKLQLNDARRWACLERATRQSLSSRVSADSETLITTNIIVEE